MLYLFFLSAFIMILCCIAPVKKTIAEGKWYKFHINKSKITFYIVFIALITLTAFRGSTIGNDTLSYHQVYQNILDRGFDASSHYEAGFQCFCLLVGKISSNPQTLIICSSACTYILVKRYFERKCYMPIFAFGLFFGLFFSQFTNVIRHAMAAVLLLYAYDAIENKKKIVAIILTVFAISFQKTAICFVPYIIVRIFNVKFMPKLFCTISVIVAIVSFFGSYIVKVLIKIMGKVDEYYLRYLTGLRIETGFFGVLFSLLLLGIMFWGYMKSTNKHSRTEGEKWAFGFSFLFFLMAFAMNLFDRIASYYELMLIVPIINKIIEKGNRNTKKILCCITGCIIISFLVKVVLRPEWNNLYPYQFFWNE